MRLLAAANLTVLLSSHHAAGLAAANTILHQFLAGSQISASCAAALFGSVTGIITVFAVEKAVFKREYGSNMYGLPAYFLSRWVVELPARIILPILGAVIAYWLVGYQV
jgi:ABC-2 type transporter